MDPEEIFCRIYSQYVLTKSMDAEAADELNRIRQSPDHFLSVWAPKEFDRLQQALEIELKKIGYL